MAAYDAALTLISLIPKWISKSRKFFIDYGQLVSEGFEFEIAANLTLITIEV